MEHSPRYIEHARSESSEGSTSSSPPRSPPKTPPLSPRSSTLHNHTPPHSTQLCQWWVRNGYCWHGAECRYVMSHTPENHQLSHQLSHHMVSPTQSPPDQQNQRSGYFAPHHFNSNTVLLSSPEDTSTQTPNAWDLEYPTSSDGQYTDSYQEGYQEGRFQGPQNTAFWTQGYIADPQNTHCQAPYWGDSNSQTYQDHGFPSSTAA